MLPACINPIGGSGLRLCLGYNAAGMRKAIVHLRRNDPVLAAIIDRIGPISPSFREPDFASVARSIVFQQLNGRAAKTIFDRFQALLDGKITPDAVLATPPERLRTCGLSKQKLSYLQSLAEKTRSGEVDFARLPAMSDAEVIAHLTRVKGIGTWSAQMFLMFALRRPNVLPTGDYGIRAAIKKAYRKRQLPNPKQMLRIARPWEPYCTLACFYLWRSLDVQT